MSSNATNVDESKGAIANLVKQLETVRQQSSVNMDAQAKAIHRNFDTQTGKSSSSC